MNVTLKEISELEFKSSNIPSLFKNKLGNKIFGKVCSGAIEYKLAWQSITIKPSLVLIDNNCYSIAIDLNFVIVDFKFNKIILDIALDYFFYNVKINNHIIYVITELEIILISSNTYKLINVISLPDYFADIKFLEKNKVIIYCVDDKIIEL